jgi:hypothetical protein
LGRAGGSAVSTVDVVSEPLSLMCLDPECHRCEVTTAVGRVGPPGAGGGASVVGRRRRYRGRGGGRLADAPLFQTSGRYVLVLLSYLKFRKLTCLDVAKIFS